MFIKDKTPSGRHHTSAVNKKVNETWATSAKFPRGEGGQTQISNLNIQQSLLSAEKGTQRQWGRE